MEFKDNQAIYLQIADHFCINILQEKWKPDEKVPSVREVAVQFEVNPNTVMRTFGYLQDQGIIYNKRGIGYFVASDGYTKTRTIKKDQFYNESLPVLFRTMNLLEISIADLTNYYKEYIKK